MHIYTCVKYRYSITRKRRAFKISLLLERLGHVNA